jgi:di/tricarboxylate transporter
VLLTVVYVLANAFMLVLYWFPADKQKSLKTAAILPSYAGPIVGTVFYVVGFIYWLWDLNLLPRLGYRLEVFPERQEGHVVYMTFEVSEMINF